MQLKQEHNILTNKTNKQAIKQNTNSKKRQKSGDWVKNKSVEKKRGYTQPVYSISTVLTSSANCRYYFELKWGHRIWLLNFYRFDVLCQLPLLFWFCLFPKLPFQKASRVSWNNRFAKWKIIFPFHGHLSSIIHVWPVWALFHPDL